MAQDVSITISAKLLDGISKNLNNIKDRLEVLDKTKLNKLAGTVTAVSTGFLAVTKAISIVRSGLSKFVGVMEDAVSEAAAQEKQEKLLASAMQQRGIYTEELFKRNVELANSLQRLTVYQDDQILQAQTILTQMGVESSQLESVTKATLDLASAKRMDLASAADIVGKSIGTSTNALSRYGVQINNVTTSTERAAKITERISQLFGGSAQAEAKTFSGSILQLKAQWSDMLESLGNFIVKNPLVIKAFNAMSTGIASISKFLADNEGLMLALTNSFVVFSVNGIGSVIKGFKYLIPVIYLFTNSIEIMSNMVLTVLKNILKIPAALESWGNKLGEITGKKNMFVGAQEALDSVNAALEVSDEKLTKSAGSFATFEDFADKAGTATQNFAVELSKLPAEKVVEIKANIKPIIDPKVVFENNFKAISVNLTNAFKDAFIGNFDSAIKRLSGISKRIISNIGYAFTQPDFLKKITDGFVTSGEAGAKAIGMAAAGAIGSAIGGPAVGDAFAKVFDFFAKSPAEFKKQLDSFFKFFADLPMMLTQNAGYFIEALIKSVPDQVKAIVKAIPMIIQVLADMLGDPKFWDTIVNTIIDTTLNIIGNPFFWLKVTVAFVKALIMLVPNIINAVIRGFSGQFAKIFGNFGSIMKSVGSYFRGAVDVFRSIVNTMASVVGAFSSAVKFFKSVVNMLKKALDKIGGGVGKVIGGIGGFIGGAVGGLKSMVGLAGGADVPNLSKYANDNFGPVMLNKGEAVVTGKTTDRLKNFLDKAESTSESQNIIVKIMLGEKELADAIFTLNRKGYRLA
jgi:hypothetical protein